MAKLPAEAGTLQLNQYIEANPSKWANGRLRLIHKDHFILKYQFFDLKEINSSMK